MLIRWNKNWNEARPLWDLFRAIASLEDEGECALFFRDLCTLSELEAMSERWQVVRLLEQGNAVSADQ